MEQLLNILGISLSSVILVAIIGFILHWFFIYLIIKSAVRNAILEAKEIIDNIEPEHEEGNGWN